MYRLRLIILTLLVSVSGIGGLGLLYSGSAAAAPMYLVATSQSDACTGLSQLGGTGCGAGAQTTIGKVINTIVRIISVVLGAVGVIMVIVAGFKYITSGGDAGAVSSAKTTLIYALVGLAVAALAQFLVDFVFNSFKS